MGTLREDYKDALFDGQRRYQITQNEDGTYTILDATTYTQEGDKFGANDINGTNAEVNRVAGELENKAPSNHTHTASEVGAAAETHTHTPASIGAAATSHGNHVPATETANNAKFLRNDNTWQPVTPANIGAAASSHNHAASNITSGTLPVARGGTGAATFASGAALVGAGTGAVTTRAITNNTSSATCSGTNLPTCNTVNNHVASRLNRTDSLTAANTSYTTYMARAVALVTSVPSSMTNGCCAFVYS